MSGGVDSSVAAHLLKEEGYDVIGATIKTWTSDACRDERAKGCCSIRDIDDARSTAACLGIPHYVLDLSADFKTKVVDYFVETYLQAKTPNPCIACNNDIKFGVFVNKADELGADFVATGHYARKVRDASSGRWTIAKGKDLSKDQSYVLFGLDARQIERSLFPVGDYDKEAIRRVAQDLGLRVFDKPDSQEICFVSGHYADFIAGRGIALPGKGRILDRGGSVVGEHDGYHLYTIGQRKRIGVTNPEPYYVTAIDRGQNTVIVGSEEDLYNSFLEIRGMNWILPPTKGERYGLKIRSRQAPVPGLLEDLWPDGTARIAFEAPERAPTPGQAAVLYDDDRVVGGGWIEKTY